MPPGRVLKAWISQGSLERAGIWRSLRLRDVRVVDDCAARRFFSIISHSLDHCVGSRRVAMKPLEFS